jgi:3-hydroxyisobutyrate dehydrogenase-like beta-hydroxyacid dehydrogenase
MDNRKVGIIGLGLVGQAIAKRLTEAGFVCIGFDVLSSATANFLKSGYEVAKTVSELSVQTQTIVLAVFETAGVLEIAEGGHSVNSLAMDQLPHKGLTLIDCSTGDPDQLTSLAARLDVCGIGFIEAPLSGSSAQIAAGEATMLLGGREDTIVAQAPILDAIAGTRIFVGVAGMGARAKLATNLVLGLNRAALAEGMVFAQRLGIAPATFLELILNTPARSDAAKAKGQMMVNDEFAPQSRIRQHLKDVELMLGSASELGQNLPLSQAHAALMRAAVAVGDGDLDNAGIIRQIRREIRHKP